MLKMAGLHTIMLGIKKTQTIRILPEQCTKARFGTATGKCFR